MEKSLISLFQTLNRGGGHGVPFFFAADNDGRIRELIDVVSVWWVMSLNWITEKTTRTGVYQRWRRQFFNYL